MESLLLYDVDLLVSSAAVATAMTANESSLHRHWGNREQAGGDAKNTVEQVSLRGQSLLCPPLPASSSSTSSISGSEREGGEGMWCDLKVLLHAHAIPNLRRAVKATTDATVKAATTQRQPPPGEGDWLPGLAVGLAGARRFRVYRPRRAFLSVSACP